MTSPLMPALAVRNLTKRYPGVVALDRVSLAVRAGTVHALVGENGAGKSTLIKVITGALTPDEGEIHVGAEVVSALTPRRARELGISVIHQERQIARDLSVTENVLLGQMPARGGVVRWRKARRRVRELLDRLEMEIDVAAPVDRLGVADFQGLEIARALAASARVIVMDEPTSALAAADVERLFRVIRTLRAEDVAVVFISHHLDEIFDIADEVSVLRDGAHVGNWGASEVTPRDLVVAMLGQDPERLTERRPAHVGDVLLEAVDVQYPPALRGVTVSVRAGEIVCVTGTRGSGRRELARCLCGIQAPLRGRIEVCGGRVRGPREAVRRGVAFFPEDRKREGLMLDLDIADNIGIGLIAQEHRAVVAPRRVRRDAADAMGRLRIKAMSHRTPVRLLSGGNQQKVMLARGLQIGARVFIFDEPTAGIDVGAKIEIYGLLRKIADDGAAMIVFSSDPEEIRVLASRVLVLRRGTVASELASDAVNPERLTAIAQGAD